MAYVFKEELEEGDVEADVVAREDYDQLVIERDGLAEQRDVLIGQVETAERERDEAKNKYADAFITSPARAKADQEKDVADDGRAHSFKELFKTRGEYGAY